MGDWRSPRPVKRGVPILRSVCRRSVKSSVAASVADSSKSSPASVTRPSVGMSERVYRPVRKPAPSGPRAGRPNRPPCKGQQLQLCRTRHHAERLASRDLQDSSRGRNPRHLRKAADDHPCRCAAPGRLQGVIYNYTDYRVREARATLVTSVMKSLLLATRSRNRALSPLSRWPNSPVVKRIFYSACLLSGRGCDSATCQAADNGQQLRWFHRLR